MSDIEIKLNGEPRTLSGPCSVTQLIEDLGYAGRRIAVERNGAIVPRSQHAETPLQTGDVLEIVVAVGGG